MHGKSRRAEWTEADRTEQNTDTRTHTHTHLNAFRAAGVLERAQRLLEVAGRRGEGGEHGRQGVASETLLQNPCQLGVPVRDEHPLLPVRDIHQSIDHITQA